MGFLLFVLRMNHFRNFSLITVLSTRKLYAHVMKVVTHIVNYIDHLPLVIDCSRLF
jgi:hypothetical protein